MAKEYKTYAQFSNAAYAPDNEKLVPKGYARDTSLSDKDRSVYHNASTKHTVVAFRGTDVRNKGDLLADAAIATGHHALTKRFRDSTNRTRAAVKKYGKENVEVTGHSLGGTQAMHVSSALNLPGHAFNPGASYDQTIKDIRKKPIKGIKKVLGAVIPSLKRKFKSKANVYLVKGDPISGGHMLTNENKVVVKKKARKSAHSLENFL